MVRALSNRDAVKPQVLCGMQYSRLEMPSWWGGRMKALRRIPKKDIVDAVFVSLFLLALSALMVVPMITNM